MTVHHPEQRVLIIVGNDLVGDSRVQKIISSSVLTNKQTWVLCRKSRDGRLPSGLEGAKFLSIPFNTNSHAIHVGYGPTHDIIRAIQRLSESIRMILSATKVQVKYRSRRGMYHSRRMIGRALYSSHFPKPLRAFRSRILDPRRERFEFQKGTKLESLKQGNLTSDPKPDTRHPDFSNYLNRMYTLFVNPAIKCKPNLIHANDADTLRIAVSVKEYWAKRRHHVAVVYDAHEYTAGVHRPNPTWKPAMLNQEENFINRVDAVVTVSGEIADLLFEEYQLITQPTVVLNAPSLSSSGAKLEIDSLRKSLALSKGVPLFVYVGVSAHARGIHTVVEALKHFPEAHLAILTRTNSYVKSYIELAKEIGVDDRLHVQGYVPQDQVSPYIADATAGVNPVLHHPNHEMSCFTKFYEYLHAHLPIVTSDVKTMARETKERGIGTVFIAEDSLDCARAMKELCKGIDFYRASITDELISEWSWEVQSSKLNALYTQVITERA